MEEGQEKQRGMSKGAIAHQEREAERKRLREEVERLTKENADLIRLKSTESELSQVKSQLTKAQSELNVANGNLTKIKTENKDLTDKLSKLNQGTVNLTTVNSELNQVKQELNQVKSENEKLNQEAEKLKRINEGLKKDFEDLTTVNADLKKKVGSLTDQVANLTKANKDLTEINEQLNWDSQELKRINQGKNTRKYIGIIALNILMVFTALAASFANVIHLGERYLTLIKDPTDLDKIVCYVSMTVFDLCIFFFAIYGRSVLARIFAGAIMFIVFTKLATPFFEYEFSAEYIERFLVGLAYSGFLAFVSVVMSEVLADKINGKLK